MVDELRDFEAIELRVVSPDAAPAPQGSPVAEDAANPVADVVAVAVAESLGELSPPALTSLKVIVDGLRPGVLERIQLLRQEWGSWEGLFAVPPDTLLWILHELGPLATDLLVRVGERVWDRLRSGEIDHELVEQVFESQRSTFEVHFPSGRVLGLTRVNTRTKQRFHHQVRRQTKASRSPGPAPTTGRKGRKPRRRK
jgi:hypothetical protein